MTTITKEMPRIIRARMHPDTLSRVPRMFNASPTDTLNELFQNARRSGATRIDVIIRLNGPGNTYQVIVEDDGRGITNPQVLLSYGENSWEDGLTEREDAAGMGFAALANLGCVVSSKTADSAEWALNLEPDHFLGKEEAEVLDLPPEETSFSLSGTRVSYFIHASEYEIDRALSNASYFLPIPVWRQSEPANKKHDGKQHTEGFLKNAVHTETFHGITIGVFNTPSGVKENNLNFHGLVLHTEMPSNASINGVHWKVACEVNNCSELELVLPTRKEAVENDFLRNLRQTAQLAIYRAMSQDPNPQPSFNDWHAARKLGISVRQATPELIPWRPITADWNGPGYPNHKIVVVDLDQAILVDKDLTTPEAQVLWLAACEAKQDAFLFKQNSHLVGYDWYSQLDKMENVVFNAVFDGNPSNLREDEIPDADPLPRADAIIVKFNRGKNSPKIVSWSTQVAFYSAEEYPCRADEIPVVLTKDNNLTTEELENLFTNTYFSPSEDTESDSYYTQKENFRNEATIFAVELLQGSTAARRYNFIDLVNLHLRPLLADTDVAVLTLTRDKTDLVMSERPAPPKP